MKLKEKIRDFFIYILILLFIYLLCPNHDWPQGTGSRIKGFCAMPFYIIILFSFVIVFFYLE